MENPGHFSAEINMLLSTRAASHASVWIEDTLVMLVQRIGVNLPVTDNSWARHRFRLTYRATALKLVRPKTSCLASSNGIGRAKR